MTQAPQHLSPKQHRDRRIVELRRTAMAERDHLSGLTVCPNPGCDATLEVHGEGRTPDPYLRCPTCGWAGDVFQHTMLARSLRWQEAVNWLQYEVVCPAKSTPADSGKPFRWTNPDGSIGYDLPELTRRVRNAWPTTVDLADPDVSDWGDDNDEGRMLTVPEWEAVCELLDQLPTVYAERDQARRAAMQLEEELARR